MTDRQREPISEDELDLVPEALKDLTVEDPLADRLRGGQTGQNGGAECEATSM